MYPRAAPLRSRALGLNLAGNPGNLGKQVTLKGNIEKYFGVAGFKSTSAYTWGPKGE